MRSLRVGSRTGAPHWESIPEVVSALREYHQAIDVADRFEDWESVRQTAPFTRAGRAG